MKCVCGASTTSYERLDDAVVDTTLTFEDKDSSNEKEVSEGRINVQTFINATLNNDNND